MLKNSVQNQENVITTKQELCEIFYSGFKNCEQKNVGVEFEKLPLNSKMHTAASYFDVAKFLCDFQSNKKYHWQNIRENGAILGLKNANGTITLEPGSQTELSLEPKSNIHDIRRYIDHYNKDTSLLAQQYEITWLGYGIQPVSTYRNINIIPKKRYKLMTQYLPTVAKRPLVMMRETAGIQASFDYQDEQDAMRKFSLALKLSPIVSAMFANSPIRNGHLTKYKSNRAASWLDTDGSRCGLVSSKAFQVHKFSFEEYVEILLDVPMIFIERENEFQQKIAINLAGITFREFMNRGYNGYFATKDDWLLHISLYFPDVRFKNYIEIRNHDNQRKDLICAVPAFWKGILYNNDAILAVQDVLKSFSYFDFEYMRKITPKKGLDLKIKNLVLKDLVQEIIEISYASLKSYGKNEDVYLEPLIDLSQKGLTPADVIIQKWENEWQCKIEKLIEYTKLD